jgi:hypothetical protein
MADYGKRVGGGRPNHERTSAALPARSKSVEVSGSSILVDFSSSGARFRSDVLPAQEQ